MISSAGVEQFIHVEPESYRRKSEKEEEADPMKKSERIRQRRRRRTENGRSEEEQKKKKRTAETLFTAKMSPEKRRKIRIENNFRT